MRRTLPPTNALVCFEVTVRLGSVTRAAEELNLTQSAVSKRIVALEEYVGQTMFLRKNRTLVPTQAAQEYAAEIADIIHRMDIATTRLLSHGREGGLLTVASLPTFGSRWLVPRIASFMAKHPTTAINLISRMRPFEFDKETAQLAIHFGDPIWPGAICEYLMDERVIAVCAPQLVAAHAGDVPWDVLDTSILIQHTTRPQLWRDWLLHAGGPTTRALAGPRFEQYAHVIEAAVAGIGFAILPDFLVRTELESGTLVMAHHQRMTCREKYYAAYPERYANSGNIRNFVRWLKLEMSTI